MLRLPDKQPIARVKRDDEESTIRARPRAAPVERDRAADALGVSRHVVTRAMKKYGWRGV